ncbi:MAG: ATP-binding protein [Rhizomicrobium sp.]
MRLSEEGLNAVLAQALVAALVVDQRGIICFANAAAEQAFGYPAPDMLGHPLELLIPPSLRDAHRRGFDRFMLSPSPVTLTPRPTLRALHRDGHEFLIDIRLSPIETEAGPRVYCVVQDVSRQRRLEEEHDKALLDLTQAKAEAEAASAMKSWFIGAAGHDLRRPLQAAQAYLSVMEQKLEYGELEDIAVKTRQSLAAMASILDVLLDLGQIDSGTIKPRIADFRLGELVQRVIASCQPQAAIKDLRLTCEGEDPVVRSDPALLERIVTNFVGNAVRYTESGGVSVSCEAADDVVRLSVSDTGIGIPPESLATIFDDYVQLGNLARDRQRGMGLGLSIAKRLAQALGHSISVRSTPGEGSTFTVEIPEGHGDSKRRAEQRDVPIQSPASTSGTFLLVDDDSNIRESLAMLLETFGMTVHTAANGAEALALIAGGLRPDMILTDYRLPGYDGLEVIARVRGALNSEVPAILITGDMAPRSAAHPANFALLYKPFSAEELRTLIEKMRRKPGPKLTLVSST